MGAMVADELNAACERYQKMFAEKGISPVDLASGVLSFGAQFALARALAYRRNGDMDKMNQALDWAEAFTSTGAASLLKEESVREDVADLFKGFFGS